MLLLPPTNSRNSDPGSHSRLVYPLPTIVMVRALIDGIVIARRVQHFLPSLVDSRRLVPGFSQLTIWIIDLGYDRIQV